MTITVGAATEELIPKQLERGGYKDSAELVARAVQAMAPAERNAPSKTSSLFFSRLRTFRRVASSDLSSPRDQFDSLTDVHHWN